MFGAHVRRGPEWSNQVVATWTPSEVRPINGFRSCSYSISLTLEAGGQNAERQWRLGLDGPTGGVASPLPRQAQASRRLMNCWWRLEGQVGGTVRGWCLLGPQAAQPQELKRTTWEPCGNEECRMKNAE